MARRSGKFYRKNEREVMCKLGMKPTKNSGSGWIEKEDGQNDYIICQLKSTDAQSISVKQKDLRILEENALVCKKIPVFAIQFLNEDEVWLMVKPEDAGKFAEYINTGKCEVYNGIDMSGREDLMVVCSQVIKSDEDSRYNFHEERNTMFESRKALRKKEK